MEANKAKKVSRLPNFRVHAFHKSAEPADGKIQVIRLGPEPQQLLLLKQIHRRLNSAG
jgi:hypothetical protein